MTAIDTLPPLREVIARHGLMAKKALGQNFLLDLNLTSRIARASGPLEGATVVEVGPGPGGLTRALLAGGAARVIAIERDARCLPALAEVAAAYPGRLEVIEADALKVDMAALTAGAPARIVANLPYNIGTNLLTGWLTGEAWPPWYQSLTLMFQKEVAQRIVAAPGSDPYGRLGVLCGWRTEARIMFDVAPSAFVPPPKITSSVVHLVPRAEPLPCAVKMLERVTLAAFGQRRKMIRQSLKGLVSDPMPLIEAAGLDPTERAENLTIEDFCRLARLAAG
ncbi:16S rRNA (adenine(1518)-N(6)/adenine(1519)-N(6))-dimethyltransferase RsmA [Phreatobacter sp. HK31-P]